MFVMFLQVISQVVIMLKFIWSGNFWSRARGYKTFFMLNSTEDEIFSAHKCENANNCWHFNIYEQEK